MEMNFDQMLEKITAFIQTEAKTDTIVGDAFQLGEYSCVPVIRVGLGFGTGGGENDTAKDVHNSGGGAGAGMGIEPIGFLATHGSNISFISTKNNKGLAAVFERVPDLLTQFMESRKKEEKVAV